MDNNAANMNNQQIQTPPTKQQPMQQLPYGAEPLPDHQQQPTYGSPQGQQPYQPPQTNYAQNPNVENQEWEAGLCNCSPLSSCCLGTFLPCMLLGKTSERMRDSSLRSYESINTDCMLMCGITYFTCFGWVYIMMKRSEIRERFGIKGGGLGDCCTSFWCSCCALIQQDNEVKARLAAGPNTQGYQPNKEGMNMAPPARQNY